MPLLENSPDRTREFKREQRARFVLREGFLDAEKSKELHRLIPHDSPIETMRDVERGIRSGEFKLLDVLENGQRVGFTVYAIVEGNGTKEFLSVASHGKSNTDLSRAIIPMLEAEARKQGCNSIRLHTMRTGLIQKLISIDWYVSEIVMRKEIK